MYINISVLQYIQSPGVLGLYPTVIPYVEGQLIVRAPSLQALGVILVRGRASRPRLAASRTTPTLPTALAPLSSALAKESVVMVQQSFFRAGA